MPAFSSAKIALAESSGSTNTKARPSKTLPPTFKKDGGCVNDVEGMPDNLIDRIPFI
jgi:hypothetical protein